MSILFTKEVRIASPDETDRLAALLAPLLKTGDVLLLSGPLGAGKTHFARALIRARTGNPHEDVPSPTFTLAQHYAQKDGPDLWHFDLYRIKNPEDIFELGIEDAFEKGISLIEWPERMADLMPQNGLIMTFTPGEKEGERLILLQGDADWKSRLEKYD